MLMVTRSPRLEGNPVYHKFNGSQQRASCGTPYYKSRDAIMDVMDIVRLRMWRPCLKCYPNSPLPNVVGPMGVRSAHKADNLP